MSSTNDHKGNILIVDDEPVNLRLLVTLLARHGYKVRTANTAQLALEAAIEKTPDLILLDIGLPDMDGYELCLKLKADENTEAAPVIFISALTDTTDKVKGFEVGGVDYVTKPFQVQEVLARVRTQLAVQALQTKLKQNNRQLRQEIEERQRAESALQKARDELEVKVAERTSELVAINQRLKSEIAERRQIEEALRASEERYRTLYVENPSMFFTLDTSGTVISVNDYGASQLGYQIDELVGENVLKVFHEDDRTAVVAQLKECLDNPDKQDHWQFRKVRKDGSVLWVEEFARAVPDANGETNVLIVCHDITDRKQAQLKQEQLMSQVREQAQKVKNIIDTVQDGVILLSENRVVTLTNPVARQYLSLLAPFWQHERLEYLGSHQIEELLTSPPQGLWHDVSIDNQQFGVIAHPVEHGPTNRGWVLVLRDVTQERAIQQRIQKQERLAAVGQLAAGIAHDFNNILSVISLYSQLALQSDELSPYVRNWLRTIEEQSMSAANLIQQILDFSRQSMLKRQPLDLLSFLKELIKLLKRTLSENIHIELDYDEDEYIIDADLTRMQQVFMNLAFNARDAMPDGGRMAFTLDRINITENVSPPLPGMPPGDWVRITLADSGQGIPSDVLSHIFEPFFTTKGLGRGTGLGLAQVYGIVQQHQGFIDATSQVDAGTTFSIYFPAKTTARQDGSSNTSDNLRKGHHQVVLIVEDEPAIREALKESLSILKYSVIEARNGTEALALLRAHGDKIELVLSDVVMPDMGGTALLHEVHELGLDVPFALMTGHAVEEDMQALRKLGLKGWILKPPVLRELSDLLARLLAQQ